MDAATSILIETLDAIDAGARPLIVNEETGALRKSLVARGADPMIWNRRACGGAAGTPWPGGTEATSAFVRLEKSKDAFVFALHGAASVLPAGALIFVFGANAEGVRSAAPRLADVADNIETVMTKRHCRVLRGGRKSMVRELKTSLADWRREESIAFPGTQRRWISYPGVFADGGLDDGTQFLLQHLPKIDPGARVLDFAAGTGVVAAAVLDRAASAQIDLLEIDSLALEAARENVRTANRFIAGDNLAVAGDARYDLILSNPPIHNGIAESHAVLERLIADAPKFLRPRGELRIVVQRRVKVMERFKAQFGRCEIVADDGRFTVISARAS